jgi:hypothetical protein
MTQPTPTAFNDAPDQNLRAEQIQAQEYSEPSTKFHDAQGASDAPAADVQVGSHLKSSDDLTGFPIFPAGTKSLLCKLMTRDIWNKY